MTTVANTVLKGEAAYLVSAQAELLTEALGCEIRKLATPDLRIGVYDPVTRRLVIFDGAALAAIAKEEVAEEVDAGITADANKGRRVYLHDVTNPPGQL
jgi:hypothetical protein